MSTPITHGSFSYSRETSVDRSFDVGTPPTAEQPPQQPAREVPLFSDGFEASATHTSASTQFGSPEGPVQGGAEVEVGAVNVSGNGAVSADLANVELNANASVDASVYAVDANVNASVDLGLLDAQANGTAQVGVSGTGAASVTFDPLDGEVAASVDAEAFAGVRVGGEVSGSLGPVEASAGGELLLGVGAELEADLGFQDGVLSAHVDVGASLGIGLSLEFDVSLDVGGIVEGIGNAAEATWDFLTGW